MQIKVSELAVGNMDIFRRTNANFDLVKDLVVDVDNIDIDALAKYGMNILGAVLRLRSIYLASHLSHDDCVFIDPQINFKGFDETRNCQNNKIPSTTYCRACKATVGTMYHTPSPDDSGVQITYICDCGHSGTFWFSL